MRLISRPLVRRTLAATCALALAALAGTSHAIWWHPQEPPAPHDEREFFVDEEKLPFDDIGFGATQYWGVLDGAGYRIEVPPNWNGDLAMYTHGFRGEFPEVTVDNPPLRLWLLANGYAWAASSYSKNYYDVRAGVEDTNALVRHFRKTIAKPDRTFIHGFSMGGHIIGAAIEMYPNVKCPDGRKGRLCRKISRLLGKISGGVAYDGAVPMCGVMGDVALFRYFGDWSRGSEANAGVSTTFPPPADYYTTVFPQVLAAFAPNPDGTPSQAEVNQIGLLRQLSGGDRPLYDIAYGFWRDFLFGFNGSGGDVSGIVSGNLYDNIGKVYQFDADPSLTDEEKAFNENIARIAKDKGVNPKIGLKLQRIPEIHGRLAIPVVSMHTLGDLFVPFSMQTIYAAEAKKRGRSDYLASRATRNIGHCQFSGDELVEAFQDMVDWVDTGVKAAGDNILDPEALAADDMGCQFTRGGAFACPAP